MISTPRMAIRPASSCTVITSGITTSRAPSGLLGLAALALLAFAFAGPADRGQRAHALDGVLVVAGQRLDGQAALAALRLALGARDGLARRGALPRLLSAFLVEVGAAVEVQAAGARGLARGALDLRSGRRRRGPPAGAGRPRAAGTAAAFGARAGTR